jgi:hypothetical protein
VLDTNIYTRGIKIPDREMKEFEACHLLRHDFHGDWNYTIAAGRNQDATRPDGRKLSRGSNAASFQPAARAMPIARARPAGPRRSTTLVVPAPAAAAAVPLSRGWGSPSPLRGGGGRGGLVVAGIVI